MKAKKRKSSKQEEENKEEDVEVLNDDDNVAISLSMVIIVAAMSFLFGVGLVYLISSQGTLNVRRDITYQQQDTVVANTEEAAVHKLASSNDVYDDEITKTEDISATFSPIPSPFHRSPAPNEFVYVPTFVEPSRIYSIDDIAPTLARRLHFLSDSLGLYTQGHDPGDISIPDVEVAMLNRLLQQTKLLVPLDAEQQGPMLVIGCDKVRMNSVYKVFGGDRGSRKAARKAFHCTTNDENVAADLIAASFTAHMTSMLPLRVEPAYFGLVWAPYVLEVSPYPYFLMDQLFRITKPGGVVGVTTVASLEHHYKNTALLTVAPTRMWSALFLRTGFEIVENGAQVNLTWTLPKHQGGTSVDDSRLIFSLKRPLDRDVGIPHGYEADATGEQQLEFRLESFLDKLRGDLYPEPETALHTNITRRMIARLYGRDTDTPPSFTVPPLSADILDIGCSQGVALDVFQEYGAKAVGITLGARDVEEARARGFVVHDMDMNLLSFPPFSFDVVWARHVVEHTFVPLLVLQEIHNILKESGVLYIELPLPDLPSRHEYNPNHYSVFTREQWRKMFATIGFKEIDSRDIMHRLPGGEKDIYWGVFLGIARKRE